MVNNIELKPTVMVGKCGITESVITEIKNQLKNRKVIKVKILRSAKEEMNRKEIAESIVKLARVKLVELRGNILTLGR